MLETDQGLVHGAVDLGPAVQVFKTGAEIDLTAPGNSGVILSGGYTRFAFGVTSSTSGTISVQRYLDEAGTIPQGAPLTANLTEATPGVVNCTDGLPFQSFAITVTGGVLTNIGLLFQA